MKLMICGYGGHGKDEFCKHLGVPYISSSLAMLEEVYAESILNPMMPVYSDIAEFYADRINHRSFWYNTLRKMKKENMLVIAQKVFKEGNVYCGCRDIEEFDAIKRRYNGDVLTVWIDAGGRLPPEPSSCSIDASDCDIVIKNDGPLTDLIEKAGKFKKFIAQNSKGIQAEIVEWADGVFPNRTIANALAKMVMEEIPEYLTSQNDPMELADIGILLYDVAHLADVDLHKAMRKKMTINKNRKWAIDSSTGLMNHIGDDHDF